MKLVDKINKLIDEKGISMYTLSKESRISQATLSRLKSNHTAKLNRKNVKLLSEYFSVSPEWLITGNEEEKKEYFLQTTPNNCNREDIAFVPFVSRYGQFDYSQGYANIKYLDDLPRIPFIVDSEERGNYVAFEVRGDSMDDGTVQGYLDGDRLYCREVQRQLWTSVDLHQRQRDYIIVYRDEILFKRIIHHNMENHLITVHSLNPEFRDWTINLAEVKQIFSVIESSRARKR